MLPKKHSNCVPQQPTIVDWPALSVSWQSLPRKGMTTLSRGNLVHLLTIPAIWFNTTSKRDVAWSVEHICLVRADKPRYTWPLSARCPPQYETEGRRMSCLAIEPSSTSHGSSWMDLAGLVCAPGRKRAPPGTGRRRRESPRKKQWKMCTRCGCSTTAPCLLQVPERSGRQPSNSPVNFQQNSGADQPGSIQRQKQYI